ncbi:putative immunity protein [Pseudonocardia nigra]|uniref:putative immunity protein n=1 Tax=Pseudonocardia nigra TaxID=1921578 RepID=UPI003557E7C7
MASRSVLNLWLGVVGGVNPKPPPISPTEPRLQRHVPTCRHHSIRAIAGSATQRWSGEFRRLGNLHASSLRGWGHGERTWRQHHPDDRRPRAAVEAAWTFVGGANRTKLQRVTSLDAHRAAKEATTEAAKHAAHAAGDAASAAYLHPPAVQGWRSSTAAALQVGHICVPLRTRHVRPNCLPTAI